MDPQRRRLLLGTVALLASGAARAARLPATPRQTAGPFYPDMLPLDHDNDLVQVSGHSGLARGEVADLGGRILDTSGAPIAGAQVEIWQCDQLGTYHHGDDSGERDPGFQGFGRTHSAADGRYRFRTIKPVSYGGRAPHIHFKINAGGTLLTTQLYVRGHPRNADDFLFSRLGTAAASAQTDFVRGEGAALFAKWDMVIGT